MSDAGSLTVRTAAVFLLATWPRRIVLGLLLVIPLLVAAAGGFREAEPAPNIVEAGAPTDTGAYLVVPHSYFVADDIDASGLDDGEHWLGAIVEVTNQGTTPISIEFNDSTFRLPDWVQNPSLDAPYGVLRLDTGARLGYAQPGLTYEVALLWRTVGVEDPPTTLTLTMHQTALIEWSLEPGYFTWRQTGETFDVSLPLTQAPAQLLAEEEL